MRKKQYLILIIVLIVIIAAALGLKLYQNRQTQKEEEAEAGTTVYAAAFTAEDVENFSYDYSGETLVFEKSDDAWVYTADDSVDVDEDSIETILEEIAALTATDTVEDAEDVSEYGFDEPTKQVGLTLSDGTEIRLTFGSENNVLGGYYLQVSDDDTIYLVEDTLVTSTLEVGIDDLAAEEE